MIKYLLILFLLSTYSTFAQKQYDIREPGYWPLEHPVEKYWITKHNKIKITDSKYLDINDIFFYMDYENNAGYYSSLTSIIDGTKISAVYLILDYILG